MQHENSFISSDIASSLTANEALTSLSGNVLLAFVWLQQQNNTAPAPHDRSTYKPRKAA
jgi:hypothetical protein